MTPPAAGAAVADPERLRRVLGSEELRWLVERARARIERGLPLDGAVALARPTEPQRRAVARLLGRPPSRGGALHVSLAAVAAVLRHAGIATDLAAAVEALTGPIPDRAAAEQAAEAAWAAALAPAEELAGRRPALAPWAEWLRATGMLRRLAGGDPGKARELTRQAVAVLERLPARGQPLSVLAAEAVEDGHLLDPEQPLATVVVRAAALLGGVPAAGEGAEWRRTVWASVGVLAGELSNPVLTLNLPGDPRSTTGRALAAFAGAGQPVHLTARQLLRDPPALALAGRSVFVCENPSVVATAANRLGAGAAPLVCANAHPGAAATILLRRLAGAGARLRYHGDFDWPGVAIANGVIARFGASPWRLDAGAYRAAAARGGPRLRGTPVTATWDPALTEAMLTLAVKVEEERVLDDLLADLAGADSAVG